jgi:iron(III) transport system permease protein
VAALVLLPLLAAFSGAGGFADAYGTLQPDGEAAAARRWILATATGHSLAIGVLATAIAALIGVPVGWALAGKIGTGTGGACPYFSLVALPLALPPSVAVSGWVGLFAPEGAASAFYPLTPEARGPSGGWLFSIFGAALVLGMSLWPIIAFETWPGFKRVLSGDAYDAARLYATRRRVFLKILLPQVKGELAAGALLVFLLAACDFTVSSLLLVRTLPVEIHDALTVGKSAAAAWASLPLLVIVFLVAVLLHRRAEVRHAAPHAGGRGVAVGAPAARAVCVAGVALGFVLPMLVCLQQALSGGHPMSAVFGAGKSALAVSLRLAAAATLLAAAIAIVRVVLWPESRARPLNDAALFLLGVPGSFLAAALLAMQMNLTALLDKPAVAQAVLPVALLVLGFALRFVYVPLRLAEEGLAALHPDLFAAAALAGHGRLVRGVAVALPLVTPHIVAGAALVFVLAMGEVAIADRLHPPGVTPATQWLFQQQHMGYDEAVFGLSLLLGIAVAAVLLAGGVAAAWAGRWLRVVGTRP